MTGFPENETKPALSLFSLTLYILKWVGLPLGFGWPWLRCSSLWGSYFVGSYGLQSFVGVVVYFYRRRQAYRPPLYIDDDGC
jgi:hypothetical protein